MKSALSHALALAALVAAAGLTACERNDAPKNNPRLDGVNPSHAAVDMSIFDNQADIYKKQHPVAPPPAPVPTPASAPATDTPPTDTTGTPAPAPDATAPAPATPPSDNIGAPPS